MFPRTGSCAEASAALGELTDTYGRRALPFSALHQQVAANENKTGQCFSPLTKGTLTGIAAQGREDLDRGPSSHRVSKIQSQRAKRST